MHELVFKPNIKKLYQTLNRKELHRSETESVVAEFERQVSETPNNIAVVCGLHELSYAQLNARSNVIAEELIRRGVERGATVAVSCRRSALLIEYLVAVVKCGAAYVPIDQGWPRNRIEILLEETRCATALIGNQDTGLLFPMSCNVVNLEALDFNAPTENPAHNCAIDTTIYINFTSGSTGRPKAVPIPHSGVLRLAQNAIFASITAATRTLHMSPIAFDAATFEIWAPLLNGGTCIVYEPESIQLADLSKTIKIGQVNTIFLTTALFNTIVDVDPNILDGVSQILTGGEAHSTKHMVSALDYYGRGRVTSVYGPTECTTFSTFYPIERVCPNDTTIPIGKPIQETGIYVLDNNRVCDVGEEGTIHITGPGLSSGYINNPEQSARRFKTVLINGVEHHIYDTGDIGCLSEDLNILFKGREDDQVKVNGYRIELGEVAAQLNLLPEIQQSFVTTIRSNNSENQLLAFVIVDDVSVKVTELSKALAHSLPKYLIPRIILRSSPFPLTETNKIDKRALLAEIGNCATKAPQLKKSAEKIQAVLSSMGIAANVSELPASTRTANDAAHALNCEVGQIVKSLIFQKQSDHQPVLVLASGPNRVDVIKIGQIVGSPVVQASAKFVRDVTGFAIGGVPPIGHKSNSQVIVDEDLLKFESVWAAAGTPNAVFQITNPITSLLTDPIVAAVKEKNNE